jgi:hypothetical protein
MGYIIGLLLNAPYKIDSMVWMWMWMMFDISYMLLNTGSIYWLY